MLFEEAKNIPIASLMVRIVVLHAEATTHAESEI